MFPSNPLTKNTLLAGGGQKWWEYFYYINYEVDHEEKEAIAVFVYCTVQCQIQGLVWDISPGPKTEPEFLCSRFRLSGCAGNKLAQAICYAWPQSTCPLDVQAFPKVQTDSCGSTPCGKCVRSKHIWSPHLQLLYLFSMRNFAFFLTV